MSPTIQEQIDTLDQAVSDLESSPSGVLAYLTQYTLEQYDKNANAALTYYEEKADDLDDDIVDASGALRILKMGIMIEAA